MMKRNICSISALIDLNMIVETYDGKNCSYAETANMLNKAGFKRDERRSLARAAEPVIGYKV